MSGTSDIDGNDQLRSSFLPVEAAGPSIASPAANIRQHRTIASADLSGSFAPFLQFQKQEIHTVFPHFRNFELALNFSLRFLAELRGAL